MAIAFDGSVAADDEIVFSADDTFLTENSAMSFFGWIYHRGAGEGSLGRYWARNVTGSGSVQLFYNGGALQFQVNGSTSLVRNCSQSTYLPTNTWTPVLVTWDGSTTASNSHIYTIDGTEVSYSTTTNGATMTDNAAASLRIGNTADGTRCGDFIGQCFAWWGSVLTAADITFLCTSRLMYAPLMVSVQPKIFVPMDDFGEGATASGASSIVDRSGNGRHGTPNNSPLSSSNTILTYSSGIMPVDSYGTAATTYGRYLMFQAF